MRPDSNANVGLGGAQHVNWSSVPVQHPLEGIERQMVVGRNVMICRFRFAPLLVTPEHTHPHEQMSIVVSGRVRFFVEGQERVAEKGFRCYLFSRIKRTVDEYAENYAARFDQIAQSRPSLCGWQ